MAAVGAVSVVVMTATLGTDFAFSCLYSKHVPNFVFLFGSIRNQSSRFPGIVSNWRCVAVMLTQATVSGANTVGPEIVT